MNWEVFKSSVQKKPLSSKHCVSSLVTTGCSHLFCVTWGSANTHVSLFKTSRVRAYQDTLCSLTRVMMQGILGGWGGWEDAPQPLATSLGCFPLSTRLASFFFNLVWFGSHGCQLERKTETLCDLDECFLCKVMIVCFFTWPLSSLLKVYDVGLPSNFGPDWNIFFVRSIMMNVCSHMNPDDFADPLSGWMLCQCCCRFLFTLLKCSDISCLFMITLDWMWDFSLHQGGNCLSALSFFPLCTFPFSVKVSLQTKMWFAYCYITL